MGQRFRILAKTLGAGVLGLSLMGADAGAGGGAAPSGEGRGTRSSAARQPNDGTIACPRETVKVPLNAKASLDAKRLQAGRARSAIGITKAGRVVMATTGSATHGEVAELLRAKGAVEAMGLDGGASAGIYSQGVQLFTPGRNLSNVLLFGPNLR